MIVTLIKDYEFYAIIGMLDFERVKPQKIRINAEFKSESFVDYVEIINFIERIYNEHKFETVENSLEICAANLKREFDSIRYLKMEILKTEIIKNALVRARIEVVLSARK